MPGPLVKAHLFEGFDAFCAQRSIDFQALLKSAGIGAGAVTDADADIPLNGAAQVLALAAEKAGDPCLGLHWAEAYPRGAASVLGYLISNAKSVREAVLSIKRYVALHLDPVEVAFVEFEDGGRLEWRFPTSFTAPRTQYASFAMALLIINLRRYIGPTWSPRGVQLEHRVLPCQSDVARILGGNVQFDCPANAVDFRGEILDRRSASADLRLYELIRGLGDRLLAEQKSNVDIVEVTRRTLVRELESGRSTLEAIAETLDVSPRTLQSRLAAAGETYEDVLQETRRRLAETMLRDSDLAMTEIALLLGFSELSAFTRAATRWFGVPPRVFRSEVRRGAGPIDLPQ